MYNCLHREKNGEKNQKGWLLTGTKKLPVFHGFLKWALQILHAVVYCTKPSVDGVFLITLALLTSGGYAYRFT